MLVDRRGNIPQGLKPQILCACYGATKVVPFQSQVYATSSKTASPAERARSERKPQRTPRRGCAARCHLGEWDQWAARLAVFCGPLLRSSSASASGIKVKALVISGSDWARTLSP